MPQFPRHTLQKDTGVGAAASCEVPAEPEPHSVGAAASCEVQFIAASDEEQTETEDEEELHGKRYFQ